MVTSHGSTSTRHRTRSSGRDGWDHSYKPRTAAPPRAATADCHRRSPSIGSPAPAKGLRIVDEKARVAAAAADGADAVETATGAAADDGDGQRAGGRRALGHRDE